MRTVTPPPSPSPTLTTPPTKSRGTRARQLSTYVSGAAAHTHDARVLLEEVPQATRLHRRPAIHGVGLEVEEDGPGGDDLRDVRRRRAPGSAFGGHAEAVSRHRAAVGSPTLMADRDVGARGGTTGSVGPSPPLRGGPPAWSPPQPAITASASTARILAETTMVLAPSHERRLDWRRRSHGIRGARGEEYVNRRRREGSVAYRRGVPWSGRRRTPCGAERAPPT